MHSSPGTAKRNERQGDLAPICMMVGVWLYCGTSTQPSAMILQQPTVREQPYVQGYASNSEAKAYGEVMCEAYRRSGPIPDLVKHLCR